MDLRDRKGANTRDDDELLGDDSENAADGAEGRLVHAALTRRVIGAAIEVHRVLGPGLLESAYEECLCRELELLGIAFRRQVDLPIDYKGVSVKSAYRMDLVVEDAVIVELKAVEQTTPLHHQQLLTYLRLSGKRVGLLFNFNVAILRAGIIRKVL